MDLFNSVKKKIVEKVGIGRPEPDPVIVKQKQKVVHLKNMIEVLRKNFYDYSASALAMGQMSCVLSNDVAEFYRRSQDRQNSVDHYASCNLGVDESANSVFRDEFHRDILSTFDIWFRKIEALERQLEDVEEIHYQTYKQGERMLRLQQHQAPVGEVQACEDEFNVLRARLESAKDAVKKDVQEMVVSRFEIFDGLLVSMMECQLRWFQESSNSLMNLEGNVNGFRSRFEKGYIHPLLDSGARRKKSSLRRKVSRERQLSREPSGVEYEEEWEYEEVEEIEEEIEVEVSDDEDGDINLMDDSYAQRNHNYEVEQPSMDFNIMDLGMDEKEPSPFEEVKESDPSGKYRNVPIEYGDERPTASNIEDFIEEKQKAKLDQFVDNVNREQKLNDDKHDARLAVEEKLDKWENKNGVRKNLRTLITTVNGVLWYDHGLKRIDITKVTTNGGVKKSYFKVMRVVHPDRVKDDDPMKLVIAERVFGVLNEEYDKFRAENGM